MADLATIADPDHLSLALAAVASGWAQEDPQAAAKWVVGLPSADQRGAASAGLISMWGASAPADCLAWVGQHPADDLRDESLVKLADVWGSGDPQAAGNSEALLAGIARGWSITEDSAAEEWIASLPDPDLAARLRAARD